MREFDIQKVFLEDQQHPLVATIKLPTELNIEVKQALEKPVILALNKTTDEKHTGRLQDYITTRPYLWQKSNLDI